MNPAGSTSNPAPRRPFRKAWRLGMTAVGFLVFWSVALLINLTLVPLLSLCTRNRDHHERRCRWIIHQGYRFFMWMIQRGGLCRFVVEGRENLAPGLGCVVVANHPTLIDVIAIVSLLPSAACLVKEEMARHFFLRHLVGGARYISNVDPKIVIDTSASEIHRGQALVVFPEGTRSPPGGLRPFRRGAANIAAATGCPIIPVVVTMDPPTLMKGQKWYHIPDQKALFRLRIGTPIDPASLADPDLPRGVRARRMTESLHHHFKEQLGCE